MLAREVHDVRHLGLRDFVSIDAALTRAVLEVRSREVPFIIEQDVPKTGTAPIPLPGREWTTASLTRQRCSPAVVVAQPGLVGVLVGPRITHLEIGNALLFLPLPSIDPSIHATILRNVQVRTMAAATMSIQYE